MRHISAPVLNSFPLCIARDCSDPDSAGLCSDPDSAGLCSDPDSAGLCSDPDSPGLCSDPDSSLVLYPDLVLRSRQARAAAVGVRMGPVELLHMSVFSQSFSPCGRFLAAGNNYGEIGVFSLSAALSPDATALSQKPVLTFTAHEGPVFSLLSTDCHLLSAGNGEISAWSWSELIKKNVKPVWTKRPNYKSSLEIPEINAMTMNPRDNSLVVGGGDNNVHILDLEHGAFKSVLQGHSDYIHCVSVREREGEILSGGEDGAVRMWDSRTGRSVHCIEVHKYESCARPQVGKWISCLTTDSDWMLCGGGPSLSLWHLRSLSPTSVFPLSGCQRQATFHQDMILAVGEGPFVSHCLLGGEVKAQIPCTPQSLNTLQLNTNSTEHRVLTAAGSSDHIDVFTNLSYRAFSLSF